MLITVPRNFIFYKTNSSINYLYHSRLTIKHAYKFLSNFITSQKKIMGICFKSRLSTVNIYLRHMVKAINNFSTEKIFFLS